MAQLGTPKPNFMCAEFIGLNKGFQTDGTHGTHFIYNLVNIYK